MLPVSERILFIFGVPKSFNFIPSHPIITSETKNKSDSGDYPENKIFKNNGEFHFQLSYFFEFLAQDNNVIHSMSIPEEPPVLLPFPESPPLTSVSLTSFTTKWGDYYKERREYNYTCC